MTIPKFLIGDNSEFQDHIFVIHTEFPRFIIDLTTDEVEYLEEFDAEDQEQLEEETANMVQAATTFYDAEIAKYEA